MRPGQPTPSRPVHRDAQPAEVWQSHTLIQVVDKGLIADVPAPVQQPANSKHSIVISMLFHPSTVNA